MKTYYSNYFINGTYDFIGDWLNSFEDKREGRPNCEYNLEIEKTLVTSDGILLIVKVFEHERT